MNTNTLIALFILISSAFFFIAYIFYAVRTYQVEREFFWASVLFVVGSFFLLLYGIVNYYSASTGKGLLFMNNTNKEPLTSDIKTVQEGNTTVTYQTIYI